MAKADQKKTFSSWAGIAAAVLAIATAAATLIAPGFAYGTYDIPLIIMLAVGAALGVLCFLSRADFLPLVTTAVFGCALGRTLYRAAPVIADKANNISFQGGNFSMVVAYLAFLLVACLLLIAACFQREKQV